MRRGAIRKALLVSAPAFAIVLGLLELVLHVALRGMPMSVIDTPQITRLPPWEGFADRDLLFRSQRYQNPNGECEPRLHYRNSYYNYFLWGPVPNCQLKYNFDPPWGERRTINPVPAASAERVVWIFGGSTMQDSGSTDEYTIASQLSARLNKAAGRTVAVRNFGTGGFQSTLERIRFMEILKAEARKPDLVVFYDGYNDSGYGWSPGPNHFDGELENSLRMVVEQDDLGLISHSSLNFLRNNVYLFALAEKGIAAIRPPIGRLLGRGPPQPPAGGAAEVPFTRDADVRAAVANYLDNQRMVRAVAAEYGLKTAFFLQPLIFTKDPLGPFEMQVLGGSDPSWIAFGRRFYDVARTEMSAQNRPDVADISDALQGRTGDYFYDYGHISPFGDEIIAERIAQVLLDRRLLN